MYQSPSFSVRWIVELKKTLKGLCHPRCMRKLIITLKSLAQLFQIPSESSGGCFIALDVNVKVYRLILKNWLYSTESDSGCRNQTNLRRNTPLRKRPTGVESACAPADIVSLSGHNDLALEWFYLPRETTSNNWFLIVTSKGKNAMELVCNSA